MMLTPFYSLPGLEVCERALEGVKRGLNDVVRSGHIDRTIRVSQAKRLFRTEGPLVRLGVELNIAAGALIGEPLTNISLVGIGPLCQLGGCQCARGKFLVEPQSIADQHQRRTQSGAEITDRFSQKFVELCFVDGHDDPPLCRISMY